tara:strand:- start:1784 stop:2284 length:501 start_codon:yes stop_codon:yes gene_type:complete
MKKIVTLVAITCLSFIFTAAISDQNSCNIKELKKEGISNLNPFYYSTSKISTIEYDYTVRRKEIEVPLFKGEKYRMVFNKKDLPKDVVIEIYDKDKNHEGRTALFTSENSTGDIISFEPSKSKRHYVNYVIPKADGEVKSGCLVFVLGYQLTFIDTSKEEETTTEE